MMARGGRNMLWGSEKCQNKHSVAIAGIDLCHIYIYIYIYIFVTNHGVPHHICNFRVNRFKSN
jgi:hypothetical protein